MKKISCLSWASAPDLQLGQNPRFLQLKATSHQGILAPCSSCDDYTNGADGGSTSSTGLTSSTGSTSSTPSSTTCSSVGTDVTVATWNSNSTEES